MIICTTLLLFLNAANRAVWGHVRFRHRFEGHVREIKEQEQEQLLLFATDDFAVICSVLGDNSTTEASLVK